MNTDIYEWDLKIRKQELWRTVLWKVLNLQMSADVKSIQKVTDAITNIRKGRCSVFLRTVRQF